MVKVVKCGSEILKEFRCHLKYVFISLILRIITNCYAWDSSLPAEQAGLRSE